MTYLMRRDYSLSLSQALFLNIDSQSVHQAIHHDPEMREKVVSDEENKQISWGPSKVEKTMHSLGGKQLNRLG